MANFVIREACERDLGGILEVELKTWQHLGTPVLTAEDFGQWFANSSPFFLIAEYEGKIKGYFYGQLVNFSLEQVDHFTSAEVLTGTGYTTHVHDVNGNSVQGLCAVSTMKGAGAALSAELYTRVHRLKKHFYFGTISSSVEFRFMSIISKHDKHIFHIPKPEYQKPPLRLGRARKESNIVFQQIKQLKTLNKL